MRIAVISDVHAYQPTEAIDKGQLDRPSFVSTATPLNQPTVHPIAGLRKLITENQITADLIVCPGDLSDKADTSALIYVWAQLQELQHLLGASGLLATAGNHDVDSRFKHSQFDALGALQSLTPMFPGLSEAECDRYWARHFVFFNRNDVQFLLLNSSAYHGRGDQPDKEAQRGRISERTLSAIELELLSKESQSINILICHHHLYRDNAIHETDYSEMEGADHLLRLLNSGQFGQWIVIHGHKHHPKLNYGMGGNQAPVLFGAGSLSAILYSELANSARNQFYILEVKPTTARDLRMDVAGEITAWDWIPHSGWQPAGITSGLPYKSGFGYRAAMSFIAHKVSELVKARTPFARWSEIKADYPELAFILPAERSALAKNLKSSYGIHVTFDAHGEFVEFGAA